MSTVKPQGDFTYRTTTPDSLKVSSLKVLDDPSGSSDRVDLFQSLSVSLLFANSHMEREYWFDFPMVIVKMFLRISSRSAVATSSAPVPGVCPRFVAVMCSTPVPGVSSAFTSVEFPDPVDSHLFRHRDDLFGSSSSRIASDCPGQSNLGGSAPDSPVIAFPKSRDKPFGSSSSRVSSDIPQDFGLVSCSWRIYSDVVCSFLIPLLSVDTYSGVISVESGSICDGECIVAFWPSLGRRYAHREGELLLANPNQNHECGEAGVIDVVIVPAFCSISEITSSLDIVVMVADHVTSSLKIMLLLERFWLIHFLSKLFRASYVTQKQKSSTEDIISHTILQLFSARILFQPPDSQVLPLIELLEKFGLVGCKFAPTLIELNLKLSQYNGDLLSDTSHYSKLIEKFFSLQVTRSSICFIVKQLKQYIFASHVTYILAATDILHNPKSDSGFVSDNWTSKQHNVVCKRSEEAEYTSIATASWELDWFSNLLFDLHIQLLDSVVMFSDTQAALVYHGLGWQQIFPSISLQGLSRGFDFIDQIIVALSGWFKSILDLLYCSLPRPPEASCDFS